MDRAVESGNWTWSWTARGLRFSRRKPRRLCGVQRKRRDL